MIEDVNAKLPSEEKRWLKFYNKGVLDIKTPEISIYEYLKSNNENNQDNTAINYFSKMITYKELFENIDKVASSFINMSVKRNDVVTLALPAIPEAIYSIYALNKIGAIVNLIDPRSPEDKIVLQLNEVNSTLLLIGDNFINNVSNIVNRTNVKKVVVATPYETFYSSFSTIKKIGYKIKCFKNLPNKNFITWNNMIKNNNSIIKEHVKNKVAVLIFTGGTTGVPKAVKLSNENLNSLALQYQYSGININQNQKFLDIMPPFIAYGLIGGIHMPLCCGVTNILIPKFDPNKFDELLLQHRPEHFMGVPNFYQPLLKSEKLKNEDLSFIISAGAGGDGTNIELEEQINNFLNKKGVAYKLAKGYGMTELSSCVCVCVNNECNKLGSVGIPLFMNNIAIIDPVTNKELSYNEEGEICISGPTVMIGYLNNESETNKVLKTHNGKIWLHSGDIGYIDEDGILYVKNRIKDVIIRPDGHNVYPLEIANAIMKNENVVDCAIVGYPSLTSAKGEYPKAHIVLKSNIDVHKVKKEIQNLCNKLLANRDTPYYYEFRDALPLTSIGKIDLKKLKEEDSNEITVVEAPPKIKTLIR